MKSNRPPYSQLAGELMMSPSEVHASVRRAHAFHLLHGPEVKNRSNLSALEGFLVHGLKYGFAADPGDLTRGVPTSYAAEPLRRPLSPGTEPVPVWPSQEGKQRGISFGPWGTIVRPGFFRRYTRGSAGLQLVDTKIEAFKGRAKATC